MSKEASFSFNFFDADEKEDELGKSIEENIWIHEKLVIAEEIQCPSHLCGNSTSLLPFVPISINYINENDGKMQSKTLFKSQTHNHHSSDLDEKFDII